MILLRISPRPFIYVVVNFLSQVIFLFFLFLGMVMYANKVKTKETQKLPEIKNQLQNILNDDVNCRKYKI